MSAREMLANPPLTLRRVMDFYDLQDIDLICDLSDENRFVDLMLESQTTDELKELVTYLDHVLADPTVTEQDLTDLLERCRGGVFANSARRSVAKLASRAHEFIDGKVYRPTRSD